jgi:NitT/TauT family transport system substrate-binding protein
MRALGLGAALLAAVAAAGCGGGSESRSGPTRIKVLDTEGVPSIFLELGIRRGFFKRQGLDVNLSVSRGGAATIPAVLNGNVQFGGSNVVSVLSATGRKVPIQIVAPGTFGTGDPGRDFAAMLVRRDSDIRSPKDLAGKTIAVNTLGDVLDVTDRAWLDKAGVDPSSVRFVEVEHPEMQLALESHRVDAITTIEPFVTKAAKAGNRVLGYPFYNARPGLEIGSYVAAKRYIGSHADVVKRFARAVADTASYVSAHPQALRRLLVTEAHMAPKVAQRVTLPVWKRRVDPSALATLGGFMAKYGALKQPPRTIDVVASSAR